MLNDSQHPSSVTSLFLDQTNRALQPPALGLDNAHAVHGILPTSANVTVGFLFRLLGVRRVRECDFLESLHFEVHCSDSTRRGVGLLSRTCLLWRILFICISISNGRSKRGPTYVPDLLRSSDWIFQERGWRHQ